MDRKEFNALTEKVNMLMAQGKTKAALDILDGTNWRKVHNINALLKISEVYENAGRLEDAKELLWMAHDRSRVARAVIYRLALICIKMEEYDEAEEFLEEYIDIAPHDSLQYVIQYELSRAKGADDAALIAILEELKNNDFLEDRGYELALLYKKSGQVDKCRDLCDEIILWFGEGPYVEKAIELKKTIGSLTREQEELYRHLTYSGEDEVREISISAEDDLPQVTVSTDRFATVNLQEEIKKNIAEIIGASEDGEEEVLRTYGSLMNNIPYSQVSGGDTKEIRIEKKEIDLANTEEKRQTIEDAVRTMDETLRDTEETLASIDDEQKAVIREQALSEAAEAVNRLRELSLRLSTGLKEEGREEEDALRSAAEQLHTMAQAFESGDRESVDYKQASDIVEEVNLLLQKKIDRITEEVVTVENTIDELAEEIAEVTAAVEAVEAMEEAKETQEAVSEDAEEVSSDEIKEISFAADDETDAPAEEVSEEDETAEEESAEDVAEESAESEEVAEDEVTADEAATEEAAEAPAEETIEAEDSTAAEEAIETEEASETEETAEESAEEEESPAEENKDVDMSWAESPSELAAEQQKREEARGKKEESTEGESDVDPLKEALRLRQTVAQWTIYDEVPENVFGSSYRSNTDGEEYSLTAEEKEVFEYMSPIDGMENKVGGALACIKDFYNEPKNTDGHIVITGNAGSGRSTLALGLIQVLQKEIRKPRGPVGRINAQKLNDKDIIAVFRKVKSGVLIIEKAGAMNKATVRGLNMMMRTDRSKILVIIEDTREEMTKLLRNNRDFAERFGRQIDIPIFTNDELVNFAKSYAKEKECVIDQRGLLALYNRINMIQRLGQAVTLTDVQGVMDEAIASASKGGPVRFIRNIGTKKKNKEGKLILHEKNFAAK